MVVELHHLINFKTQLRSQTISSPHSLEQDTRGTELEKGLQFNEDIIVMVDYPCGLTGENTERDEFSEQVTVSSCI